jgi:hypothetical protein
MITNAILYVLHVFLSAVAALLAKYVGVATANAGFVAAVSNANGYLAAVKDFVPVVSLVGMFGIVIVFEGSLWAYKIIKWGYQKIPGIN